MKAASGREAEQAGRPAGSDPLFYLRDLKLKGNLTCAAIPPAQCPFLLRSTHPFSRLFPPLHQSPAAESLRRASHLVCVLSPGPWVKYKRSGETLRTFIFHVRNCFSSPHQRDWEEPRRTREASQADRRTSGFWNGGGSISIFFFFSLPLRPLPKNLFADSCKTFPKL